MSGALLSPWEALALRWTDEVTAALVRVMGEREVHVRGWWTTPDDYVLLIRWPPAAFRIRYFSASLLARMAEYNALEIHADALAHRYAFEWRSPHVPDPDPATHG